MHIDTFRIKADSAVLVVIDIQQRLSAVMPEDVLQEMVKNTGILWDAAQVLGVPVLVTEQYPRGLGETLPPLEARVLAQDLQKVTKTAFSCCGEPAFMDKLNALQRRDVILCGEETHVCVLQTALDLLEAGYRVFVAADAVCSRKILHWHLALDEMRQAGCVVEPVESLLFKMLEQAGSEEFKAISRLVR